MVCFYFVFKFVLVCRGIILVVLYLMVVRFCNMIWVFLIVVGFGDWYFVFVLGNLKLIWDFLCKGCNFIKGVGWLDICYDEFYYFF